MSLVDTLDSILMLYAYAQPDLKVNRRFKLFTRDHGLPAYSATEPLVQAEPLSPTTSGLASSREVERVNSRPTADVERVNSRDSDSKTKPTSPPIEAHAETIVKINPTDPRDERTQRVLAAKTATMSSLSISLTLLSIVVALSISLIEIVGLIGENCAKCTEAAEDPEGGGLAGSWWRAWARANDASGYVGAAIGESN